MSKPYDFFQSALRMNTNDCIIWPYGKDKNGYALIKIDETTKRVNREILKRTKGPPPTEYYQAAHSCRNRDCINHQHLDWKTNQDNQLDRDRDGTNDHSYYWGSQNSQAVLTDNLIHWIRHQSVLGFNNCEIAETLTVSKPCIDDVICGFSWSWLPIQEPYIKIWDDIVIPGEKNIHGKQ